MKSKFARALAATAAPERGGRPGHRFRVAVQPRPLRGGGRAILTSGKSPRVATIFDADGSTPAPATINEGQ